MTKTHDPTQSHSCRNDVSQVQKGFRGGCAIWILLARAAGIGRHSALGRNYFVSPPFSESHFSRSGRSWVLQNSVCGAIAVNGTAYSGLQLRST